MKKKCYLEKRLLRMLYSEYDIGLTDHIAAIVGHTSPQMIMTRYVGFIKENHLKIDTNLEIFSDSFGDSLKFKID